MKTIEITGNINISGNKSIGSSSGYGVYIYDTSAAISKLESSTNSLGGIFVGGDTSDNLIEIKKSRIFNNSENGVSIFDFLRGKIFIEDCYIFENHQNGIYIFPGGEQPCRGEISFIRCHIYLNKKFGVMVSKSACNFEDTKIYENTLGPLSIDESGKKLVRIQNHGSVSKFSNKVENKIVCKDSCLLL